MPRILLTAVLLVCSNVFMTYAWYYHLKKPAWPLVLAIVASWGMAFFEYTLQVPANRFGHISQGGPMSGPQLKILQEAITLTVFGVFSTLVLRERLTPRDLLAFGLILAAVLIAFVGRSEAGGVQG